MTIGTKAAYAERGIANGDGTFRHVSKAYLSKPSVKKLLEPAEVPSPTDPKKKFLDFDKADALFAANADPDHPTQKKKSPEANGDSTGDLINPLTAVKTRRVEIQLENDIMELAKRKGETVMRKDVIDACARAGQKLQEQLKACSRRLAEKCATMTDARKIKAMMDEEFRGMLELISNDFEREFGSEGRAGSTRQH